MISHRNSMTWRIFADQSITPADVLPPDAGEEFLRRGLPYREVTVPVGEEADAGEAFGFDGGRDKTAAAFAVIESDAERSRDFGFSAEYFFQLSVNGEIVFSCLEEGNGAQDGPLAHTAKIRLKKGRNVIAFFIRGGNRGLYFHLMELPPAGLPRRWKKDFIDCLFPPELSLRVLPVVTDVTEHSAVVSVEMDSPALMRLKYRRAGSEEPFAVKQNSAGGLFSNEPFQKFRLENLRSGTEYEYVPEASGDCREYGFRAGPFHFRTASEKEKHSFLLIGDTHQPVKRLDRFFQVLSADERSAAVDRLVHLGDIRSSYESFDVFSGEYLPAQQKYFGNGIPCVFLRGNHEYRGEESGKFSERLGPTYGFFTQGKVFYLILDTGWDLDGTGKETPARADMEPFLREQKKHLLKMVGSPEWKAVKFHVVLAHAPVRGFSKSLREHVEYLTGDLFLGKDPAYRIDLWLCGDVHQASRLDPATQKAFVLFRDKYENVFPAKTYIPFPVVTLNAFNPEMPENSALRLDADASELHIRHFFPGGITFDEFIVRPGGEIEITNSALRDFLK